MTKLAALFRWAALLVAPLILAGTAYWVSAGQGNQSAVVTAYMPGQISYPSENASPTSAKLLATPQPSSTGSVINFRVWNVAGSPVAVMYVDSAATPASSPTTVAPIWDGAVPGAANGMSGVIWGSFDTQPLIFTKGLVALCSSTAPPLWTATSSCTFGEQLNIGQY